MCSKGGADASVTAADDEDRQRHTSMVQIQRPIRKRPAKLIETAAFPG
jgi:hypothetical protein